MRGENWADVLYVFENSKQNNPGYELENWKVGRRIVISDHDNLPILAFRDIPDTLSSALVGRDMEAMKRTDPRIQHRDFLARMPMQHINKAGRRTTIQSTSSVSMKMARFRTEHGMLSWTGRTGSQTIRNALWERLPEANKRANSIRGLQPPSLNEQQEIRKENAGKFFSRAGKRALTNKERNRRQEILENRIRKRREAGRPAAGGLDGTNPQPMACTPNTNGLAGREGGQGEHRVCHGSPSNRRMQPPTTTNTTIPVREIPPPKRSWLTNPLIHKYRMTIQHPILCYQPDSMMGLFHPEEVDIRLDSERAISTWSLRHQQPTASQARPEHLNHWIISINLPFRFYMAAR